VSLRKEKKSSLHLPFLKWVFLDGMVETAVAFPSPWKPQAGKKASTKLKELSRHSPAIVLNKLYLIEAESYVRAPAIGEA
jgi:hypothetical protein